MTLCHENSLCKLIICCLSIFTSICNIIRCIGISFYNGILIFCVSIIIFIIQSLWSSLSPNTLRVSYCLHIWNIVSWTKSIYPGSFWLDIILCRANKKHSNTNMPLYLSSSSAWFSIPMFVTLGKFDKSIWWQIYPWNYPGYPV